VAHTEFSSVLAQAIFNKLDLNKGTLGIREVYYGNQNKIPYSPSAVVLCGMKRRILAGVSAPGGRVENELTVYIDLHSAKINEESVERLIIDQLAETVEKKLHEDVTMGGVIIHGFVTDWSPGESFIGGSYFRSLRMTFTGKSKTYLSA